MALRYAVASGNWSATSTWNGTSSIPGNGDTVVANGYTVTIDTNVTIGGANNPSVSAGSFVTGCWYKITTVGTTTWTSIGAAASTLGTVFQATGAGTGTGVATALATLTTAAAGSGAAGGGFQVTSSSTLNSINTDIRGGTTTCLTIGGTSNFTLSGVYYNAASTTVTAVQYQGTGATLTISSGGIITSNAFINASSGTMSFSSGSTILGGPSTGTNSVEQTSTGTITVTGCTITAGNLGNAILATSTSAGSTLTINNSTINGGTSLAGGSVTLQSASTLTINSSTLTGGSAGTLQSAVSLYQGSTSTFTGCTLTAGNAGNAIYCSTATSCTINCNTFIGSSSGFAAVSVPKWNTGSGLTGSYISQSLNGSSTMYTWYDTSYVGFALPNAQDVRNGVTYGPSSTSGTCVVPSASSVAYGVSVDSPGNTYGNPTTGTAVLTSAAFATALAASGSQTALQSALTSQGYTTTRAGYLDKTNNLPASPAPAGDTSGLTAYGAAKTTDVTTAAASLSTVTTAQVQSSVSAALAAYGAATAANVTAAQLTSTAAQSAVAAALAAYGVSTLTSAAIISAVASELATYGSSTLTSSQVQSAVASALTTYGASTLTASQVQAAVIPLV
jgi:hypothetical protein